MNLPRFCFSWGLYLRQGLMDTLNKKLLSHFANTRQSQRKNTCRILQQFNYNFSNNRVLRRAITHSLREVTRQCSTSSRTRHALWPNAGINCSRTCCGRKKKFKNVKHSSSCSLVSNLPCFLTLIIQNHQISSCHSSPHLKSNVCEPELPHDFCNFSGGVKIWPELLLHACANLWREVRFVWIVRN